MSFPVDQIDELKLMFPGVAQCDEGSVSFFLLSKATLPDGCQPSTTDLLLCPTPRDNYNSRLFFGSQISGKPGLNWNGQVRVLERNWHAFSWRTPPGLRLAQMVTIHLRALQ
jgi:hypothetical protein